MKEKMDKESQTTGRHGATYDWLSMKADDRCLSVKLTQREQGPAICFKVNGKETRTGGEICGPSP